MLIKRLRDDINYGFKISLTLVEFVVVQDIYNLIQSLLLGSVTD